MHSTAFRYGIPPAEAVGPMSNHPLASVANIPAHLADVLLTPNSSTKKSKRMIVRERVLTDVEWSKKIEEKENEVLEKEQEKKNKKIEREKKKRKKEETKRNNS